MVLNIWEMVVEVPVTINRMNTSTIFHNQLCIPYLYISSTEINSFYSETLLSLVTCDTFNNHNTLKEVHQYCYIPVVQRIYPAHDCALSLNTTLPLYYHSPQILSCLCSLYTDYSHLYCKHHISKN